MGGCHLAAYDDEIRSKGYSQIAGIDEAGRGPLAGPVVAAACILPVPCPILGINDSKKLSPTKRHSIYEELVAHEDVHCGVSFVDAKKIDEVNILQATLQAMREAAWGLPICPDLFLVDGRDEPKISIPCQTVIKGDQHSLCIAAASIIAKTIRDLFMIEMAEKYPEYCFAKHKGYGTAVHREAIQEHGVCPLHRKSFLKKMQVL